MFDLGTDFGFFLTYIIIWLISFLSLFSIKYFVWNNKSPDIVLSLQWVILMRILKLF